MSHLPLTAPDPVPAHDPDQMAGSAGLLDFPVDILSSGLLTDLYQLNMLEAYLEHGKTDGL